ncbi:hypothetical protein CEP88_15365 [Roseobacter denitrificans]|uniref:Uncharacterized protein n=1 Tax=Roseobacter denitrificans (strain ATCC 33942 / OCh 114) TaxID=375451 RepID=Q16BB8_ROSDO|nr:hypothetical protein [Roseobacter denitrificans]ABG30725.1 hypothetical protein RD1_1064 [Roseobacter denitrificans OCh 114]AVL53842.1 hypothetical protein CEP88_15365 [Roseobacter denitrificans]
MADKTPSKQTGSGDGTREDRLKAALKANLARRKSQSRERAQSDGETDKTPGSSGQDKDA